MKWISKDTITIDIKRISVREQRNATVVIVLEGQIREERVRRGPERGEEKAIIITCYVYIDSERSIVVNMFTNITENSAISRLSSVRGQSG